MKHRAPEQTTAPRIAYGDVTTEGDKPVEPILRFADAETFAAVADVIDSLHIQQGIARHLRGRQEAADAGHGLNLVLRGEGARQVRRTISEVEAGAYSDSLTPQQIIAMAALHMDAPGLNQPPTLEQELPVMQDRGTAPANSDFSGHSIHHAA